jgi:lipoprotein-releasing system ATP-binding protein
MLAELQNISKLYEQPGSETVNLILDNLSLGIGEKDTIAITGPSGSGKSTLLNILGTLDKPTCGRVILGGRATDSLDNAGLAALRRDFIGFVFQLHHLLPQLTLSENFLLPLLSVADRQVRVARKERAFHLAEIIGLKELLHQPAIRLSVGESQRAAVVRALVNEPKLLLADEPTGSLDEANASQVGELLAGLNGELDLAVVIVTHSMELASRMGRIYRLASRNLIPLKTP